MIRPFVLSLALLALGAPASGSAQARPDPLAVVAEAGRVYRGFPGVCADFSQTLVVPLLGQERTGTGRLCSRAPNLFSMRFGDPGGDLVVADGKWLWVYTPSSDAKQVLRMALTSGTRGLDFYQEFLDAPADKYRAEYRGRETVAGKSVHRITLTPLRPAAYREAEVWIDAQGSLLRRIAIREENGSVRTITLSGIETARAPGDEVFRFSPPAGTQVITR